MPGRPNTILLTAILLTASPAYAQRRDQAITPAAVTAALAEVRNKYDLPALAGAIVDGKGVIAAGVVGERKRGSGVAATLDDKWHLGSNTKAMTAAAVAVLVQAGKLEWERPVARMTGVKGIVDSPINLLHLLTHRSGLSANLDLTTFGGTEGPAERRRALPGILGALPGRLPQEHRYSNLGYILVGALIEQVSGQDWEGHIRKSLFLPLGMTSAGYGGLGTPGAIDQPWPHGADGKPMPTTGPAVDNPPVMGPAGRVHCTLADWARFIADLLRGARGEPALLAPAAYKTLLTPPQGETWALGWMRARRDWGGTVYTHNGSNTMNFSTAWVAPEKDRAFLVCTNQGGKQAEKGVDEAVAALLKVTALLGHREPDHKVKDPIRTTTLLLFLSGAGLLVLVVSLAILRMKG